MLNNRLKLGLIGVVILAVGIGVGRFSKPAEVVTEIKEKEVITYVEKKEEKKDVKITRTKTINKDGSSVETEVVEDKSNSSSNVAVASSREANLNQKTKNTAGLRLSALVLAKDLSVNEFEYGISASKRVIGNISVGVIVTERRTVGLSVGLDF